MSRVSLDDQGRLEIPEALRDRYGDRYWIVELGSLIKLIPLAADPLNALRDDFEDIDGAAGELREAARRDALDRAGRD